MVNVSKFRFWNTLLPCFKFQVSCLVFRLGKLKQGKMKMCCYKLNWKILILQSKSHIHIAVTVGWSTSETLFLHNNSFMLADGFQCITLKQNTRMLLLFRSYPKSMFYFNSFSKFVPPSVICLWHHRNFHRQRQSNKPNLIKHWWFFVYMVNSKPIYFAIQFEMKRTDQICIGLWYRQSIVATVLAVGWKKHLCQWNVFKSFKNKFINL